MTNETFNPSKCRILTAEVLSFDGTKRRPIADLITAFSIVQSIETTSYKGSVRIHDMVGLLSDFPLRGEERLLLKIEPGNDSGTIDLELQVYRIDNVNTTDANDGVNFIMHFVSYTTFVSSIRKIIKSYPRDSASQVARKIFETYFSPIRFNSIQLPFATQKYTVNQRQVLYIQPTIGLSDWIIPNYTPQEAMYFLVTRAFSGDTESTSSSYRFFETLEGYYFVTDEFLIERAVNADRYDGRTVKKLIYSPNTSRDPRNTLEQIFNIEVLQNQKRVDSAEDLYSGGYYNKVVEMDLLRRRVSTKEFKFSRDASVIGMNGARRTGSSTIHTDQYMNAAFTQENAKVFNLYRDYTRNGDNPSAINAEQNLAEIVTRRVSYQHHLNNTIVSASLKGRTDIRPGDIINIGMSDFSSFENKKKNPQLSGNYLVHTVNLEMEHEVLHTVLRLVKYDWSV